MLEPLDEELQKAKDEIGELVSICRMIIAFNPGDRFKDGVLYQRCIDAIKNY